MTREPLGPFFPKQFFPAVDPGQADLCLPALRRKRVPGSSDCRSGSCRLLLRVQVSKRSRGPRGLASAGPWAVACNSSTRQTFPPRNTLARKRGVTQSLSAVRTTPTGVAGLPVTAPTNARRRSGSRLPDTTVRIRRWRSACCLSPWRRGWRTRCPIRHPKPQPNATDHSH